MNAPIIALEGLDACGKSTQVELLLAKLSAEKVDAGHFRFPGYESTPAGERIAAYLRGEFGDFKGLDPRLVASLYAADRLFQLESFELQRRTKKLLVLDRGATSNLIYTAARGKSTEEKDSLFSFVERLEYGLYGWPKESLVIFLEASPAARAKIHAAKKRLADVHEADEMYLQAVNEIALERCQKDFRWVKVLVDRQGELRRREEISAEIWNLVQEKLQKHKA